MTGTNKQAVIIVLIAALAALVVSGFVVWQYTNQQTAINGSQGQVLSFAPAKEVGAPYSLVDSTGAQRDSSSFAGKYQLIFFGYTFCPDICPTELLVMGQAIRALGESNAEAESMLQPVFITVDPERDTPALMGEYVANFHDRMVGLSGPAEDVAKVAHDFRVYYAKVDSDDPENYLMDHSSFMYLVGPDDKLVAMFRPSGDPDAIAKELERLVAG